MNGGPVKVVKGADPNLPSITVKSFIQKDYLTGAETDRTAAGTWDASIVRNDGTATYVTDNNGNRLYSAYDTDAIIHNIKAQTVLEVPKGIYFFSPRMHFPCSELYFAWVCAMAPNADYGVTCGNVVFNFPITEDLNIKIVAITRFNWGLYGGCTAYNADTGQKIGSTADYQAYQNQLSGN